MLTPTQLTDLSANTNSPGYDSDGDTGSVISEPPTRVCRHVPVFSALFSHADLFASTVEDTPENLPQFVTEEPHDIDACFGARGFKTVVIYDMLEGTVEIQAPESILRTFMELGDGAQFNMGGLKEHQTETLVDMVHDAMTGPFPRGICMVKRHIQFAD